MFRIVPILIFCIVVSIERHFGAIPISWLLLVYLSKTSKVSTLILLCLSVVSDILLALPLGLTAVLIGASIAVSPYLPKTSSLSFLSRLVIGVILGIIYGLLTHTVSIGHIFLTGILYAVLGVVGIAFTTVEEIGNAF